MVIENKCAGTPKQGDMEEHEKNEVSTMNGSDLLFMKETS